MLCGALFSSFCPAVLPDAGNYRDVCVALRQQHDREVAISQQLVVSDDTLHLWHSQYAVRKKLTTQISNHLRADVCS
jgi:hypothetical protein